MMIRYAVAVEDIHGETRYEAIGTGLNQDPQYAHLYTRLDLAQRKVKQYLDQPAHYRAAYVKEVTVTGF